MRRGLAGGPAAPTPFDLTELRPLLENFLRRDLLRILRAGPAEAQWHVQGRCEWCEFFAHCRAEMQQTDDLSRLTQLTARGKQFLRREAQVQTVSDWAASCNATRPTKCSAAVPRWPAAGRG